MSLGLVAGGCPLVLAAATSGPRIPALCGTDPLILAASIIVTSSASASLTTPTSSLTPTSSTTTSSITVGSYLGSVSWELA